MRASESVAPPGGDPTTMLACLSFSWAWIAAAKPAETEARPAAEVNRNFRRETMMTPVGIGPNAIEGQPVGEREDVGPRGAQRVARDELGVGVKVGKLIGYIEYPSEESQRGFGWTVEVDFLCSIKKGKLRPDDQSSQVKAFKKLPLNTIKEAKQFLESVLGLESE